MTPLRLSYSWYRRLYVALFIMSLGYIGLYVAQLVGSVTIVGITVDIIAACGALLVAIACIVLFIFAKKISSYLPALITFLVFALITAYLIQLEGNSIALLIAPWALICFSAALFGAYGWLPVLVLTGSYLAARYLMGDLSGDLSGETLALIGFGAILPLIAGIIVWRETPDSEQTTTTNVKNLANQLSEVATKSEVIINAIGDGVLAVDGQGIVQLINPAAQQILGWGKQDALVLNYKTILKLTNENGKDIDPSQDPLQQVLNSNQQSRGNNLMVATKSGKKLAIALVASPIGDPGAGAIAVFRDITNERAEEREQAEFISTASHEMRTPVASIEGYLGLALNPNTATVDTRGRDFILKAHEAAQHLGRLFQDLLDVSKSEDGRMQNTPRVLDIVPFTEIIVQGLRQKAADKGLGLEFVPANASALKKIMPVYHVNLDNDHIREVLDNLIENAIKYTPQGQVSVDVTGNTDTVVISIKDTGLGIPTEDIPHLFQKFYRVENADRQSIGGTGLGLYLCRRLVEAMQGRLWVESTFGSGSTFFVELPRISNEQAEQLMQEQAQQMLKKPPQAPVAPATQIPVVDANGSAPQVAAPQPAPQVETPAAEAQSAPAPAQPAAPGVRPATTVPRGELLSAEQKAARVQQLEALAAQQRGSVTPEPRQ